MSFFPPKIWQNCVITFWCLFCTMAVIRSIRPRTREENNLQENSLFAEWFVIPTNDRTTRVNWITSTSSNNKPLCLRPKLTGAITQEINSTALSMEELIKLFPQLQPGGHWEPPNCVQRQRVAILIPLRNRWHQLPVLLRYLHHNLIKQLRNYTVYVIEQRDDAPFNRGKLLNVGVLEALKTDPKLNCFILHDVDTIPESVYAIYKCHEDRNLALQMATYQKKRNYKPAYRGYTGGVLSIWRSQYEDVNGFSNEFWGWGGEDDDFSDRLKQKKYDVARDFSKSASFYSLDHELVTANPNRETIRKSHKSNLHREGLNSSDYVLVKETQHQLFTQFSVDISSDFKNISSSHRTV